MRDENVTGEGRLMIMGVLLSGHRSPAPDDSFDRQVSEVGNAEPLNNAAPTR